MSWSAIQANWALLGAGVLAFALVLYFLRLILAGTARGRLRHALLDLQRAESAASAAAREERRAVKQLDRLQSRRETAKPRHLTEAEGRLADATAMHKIRADQVLVARNLLRKVIVEEFAPSKHEAMRRRYLGDERVPERPSGR